MNGSARWLISVALCLARVSSPAQATPANRPRFEAATFKPTLLNAPKISNVDLVAADSFRYSGGLVRMDGLLISYIIFAYKLTDESQYTAIYKQLGKPFESQSYTLEARPAEAQPTADQLRLMVRSLLADRVKLALHTELRPGPVYLLTLTQPGRPGLTPHPDDGQCTPPPADSTTPVKPAAYCALLLTNKPDHTIEARVLGASLDQIAGTIATINPYRAGMPALPVLNQTGLTGNFDLHVTFRPISSSPTPETEPEAPAATFTDALRHDAGLKLAKATAPIPTLIIDHVELPSQTSHSRNFPPFGNPAGTGYYFSAAGTTAFQTLGADPISTQSPERSGGGTRAAPPLRVGSRQAAARSPRHAPLRRAPASRRTR